MKFIILLICLFSIIILLPFKVSAKTETHAAIKNPKYVAIIYNENIPTDVYHLYNWIVTNPNNPSINILKQKFYLKHTAKLIAYVSFGETDKSVNYYENVKRYGIGKNRVWHSEIMNIRKKGYRNYILNNVLPKIAKMGFKGFMFDTLDSYKLVSNKKDWPEFQRAEIKFIKKVRKKFPNKIIILNRGFSIIGKVHKDVNGIIAESLYRGLGGKSGLHYVKMSKSNSEWMLKKLKVIKNKYKLPVIIIDYVNPKNRKETKKEVVRIAKNGFIPWVTDKDLNIVGTTDFKFIKRRIIIICNSRSNQNRIDPAFFMAPLEYIGFTPVLFHVNKKLPKGFVADRYAGALVIANSIKNQKKFYRWVRKSINNGLKIFFVNTFGFPEKNRFLNRLGIKLYNNKANISEGYTYVYKSNGGNYEVPLNVSYDNAYLIPKDGKPVVCIKNKYGQKSVPFAFTHWGGYALDNTLMNSKGLWIYNPFKIYKKIFYKTSFPVPDVTTENGRRMLFAQIDGDGDFGYANFNPNEFIASYVAKNILEHYKVPVDASVIVSDLIGKPYGLHLKRAKKLRAIFRKIFKYKNVQIASHTFSHPFNCPALVKGIDKPGYELPVPDYKFSIRSNVIGSVNWINKHLAPKGKNVRVILWSGDCDVPEKAVRMAYDIGIYNVNWNNTSIRYSHPFLKYLRSMGRNVGNFFQNNAGIANEDIYTHLWRGPYYGFENVIQTFKMTDKPYRLKPIYIYYHWYSGQKVASVKALNKVYTWALKQHPIPMFLSQYARKNLDFRSTAIAKKGDGWIIKNSGNLRTLRIPLKWGYPNMKLSKGVVGYRIINGREYIALSNSGSYYLRLSHKKPNFRLIEANGMIKFFKKTKNGYLFKLKSNPYVPLHFKIQSSECKIKIKDSKRFIKTVKGNIFSYKLIYGRKAYVEAKCN